MAHESFAELERRANELDGLSTTSSTKYDAFKDWLGETFGATPAVCFLSDLAKQWTSRVGQALMGLPRLLVLLVRDGAPEDATERLDVLHEYVAGLEASIVLTGDEGAWKIALVTGRPGSALHDALVGLEPGASSDRGGTVAPEGDRPRRRARDFMTLDSHEQADLVWECLIGRGAVDMDEAIRHAAYGLREDGSLTFQRVRRDGPVYAAIEACISFSTRRGVRFDRPTRGNVRAVLRDADGFSREMWRDCVWRGFGDGDDWVERDALVRASADWAVYAYGLEMQRLRTGGRADTGIRSAINGLIRLGRIERHGAGLLRRIHEAGRRAGPTTVAESVRPLADPDAPAPAPSAPPPELEPSGTSAEALVAMLGAVPLEAEPALLKLLGGTLRTPAGLLDAVDAHLREFERAFDLHQFLDLSGAEKLAQESKRLLQAWSEFDSDRRRLAQAAILYFVESDEGDDDFRIGGLKTDRALMEAVTRKVLPEPRSA